MTRLLQLCLLAGMVFCFSKISQGQTTGAPPRTTFPTSAETNDPMARDETPDINREIVFSSIRTSCVRPGSILVISGENLRNLDKHTLALDADSTYLPIEILAMNDYSLTGFLPKDGLQGNRNYALVFQQKDDDKNVENTGLKLRICPADLADTHDASITQEILILVEPYQESSVISELQNRQLPIDQVYRLNALEAILFKTRSSNAAVVIAELETIFPQAEIDLNSDLVSAGKPRLYAKKAIGWGALGGCDTSNLPFAIGMIDGAVDHQHPAFVGQKIRSQNFIENHKPDLQHATSILSILIGNDEGAGFSGLIPGTRVFNAVALRQIDVEQSLASINSVLQGLDWLMQRQVRLINVSLASPNPNRVLLKGFVKSLNKGTIIFAAAGNEGAEAPPSFPAAIPGIFTVTAIDARNRIYNKANQGDYIDFSAPGVDVWAAHPDQNGAYVSGTSIATPHALAVASLILKNNPTLSRDVLKRALKASLLDLGTPGNDPVFGAGLLKSVC